MVVDQPFLWLHAKFQLCTSSQKFCGPCKKSCLFLPFLTYIIRIATKVSLLRPASLPLDKKWAFFALLPYHWMKWCDVVEWFAHRVVFVAMAAVVMATVTLGNHNNSGESSTRWRHHCDTALCWLWFLWCHLCRSWTIEVSSISFLSGLWGLFHRRSSEKSYIYLNARPTISFQICPIYVLDSQNFSKFGEYLSYEHDLATLTDTITCLTSGYPGSLLLKKIPTLILFHWP